MRYRLRLLLATALWSWPPAWGSACARLITGLSFAPLSRIAREFGIVLQKGRRVRKAAQLVAVLAGRGAMSAGFLKCMHVGNVSQPI